MAYQPVSRDFAKIFDNEERKRALADVDLRVFKDMCNLRVFKDMDIEGFIQYSNTNDTHLFFPQ